MFLLDTYALALATGFLRLVHVFRCLYKAYRVSGLGFASQGLKPYKPYISTEIHAQGTGNPLLTQAHMCLYDERNMCIYLFGNQQARSCNSPEDAYI